jgi:hypothetical protein
MASKKTWVEKRDCAKIPHVTVIEKTFAGVPAGSKLLISSPIEIDQFIRSIPKGNKIEPSVMRQTLALRHGADATCPVSTGIFLRIVTEAAIEEYNNGNNLNDISPFWRIVDLNSALAKKLSISSNEFETIIKLAGEWA